MTVLCLRPSLTGLVFLICYFGHHITAVHHLRDELDQVELHIDGTSLPDIHDTANIDAAPHHIFREFAAGLSSRTDLVKQDRASPEHVHEIMFGIQQRNTDVLTERLHDISDPDSSNYGRHMTREEIEEISSNPESRDAVVRYLEESGATVISQSHHGEYVTAHAPISLWEELLNTEFFLFHHTQPKSDVVAALIRAEKYSVPNDLHEHVAAVYNAVQMPLAIWGTPVMHGLNNNTGNIYSNVVTGFITPEKIKTYYDIVDNGQGSIRSTQAVFETIGAYVSPEDLTHFQSRFNLTIQPVSQYIGGHVNDEICTFMPAICGEPNLDVQYMMAVSEYSPTTHWYTDKNSFADWLLEVANTVNPPLVISISYGAGEDTVTSGEFDAFNLQAIKLGLMGITILVSSGDDGVLSHSTRVKRDLCSYVPSFPASSPYVTAIGATQGPESFTPEITCQSDLGGIITSGGGFSRYYPQPAWQSSDVEAYFGQVMGTNKEPVSGYTRFGRGYPDVALAGTAYLISIGGSWFSVSGTSASCPVFAGMISIINGARLAAKMSPVGWLNPTLYRKKVEFTNDIVHGTNNCAVGQRVPCCRQGFHATPGWDPTTGLGSVNFKLFQKSLLGIRNLEKPPTNPPMTSPTASPTRTSSPSAKQTTKPTTTTPSATSAPSKATATPTKKPSATSAPSKATATPTKKPSATSAPLMTTATPVKNPTTVKPQSTRNPTTKFV